MTLRRTRSADGTEIGWEQLGAGPPLVMLHGTLADHGCWQAVAPLLSTGCELHLVDRRGRGLSEGAPTQSLSDEIDDLAAVLSAVGGAPAICAWSYGAVIALEAAVRGRIAPPAMVLYEPPVGDSAHAFRGGFRREFDRLVAVGECDAAAQLFMTSVLRLSRPVAAVMRGFPLWATVVATVPAARHEIAELDAYACDPERLRGCRVPTTVLVGGESPPHLVEGAEAVARDLGAGQLVRLDGQHHFAHITDPAGFADVVRRALSGEAAAT